MAEKEGERAQWDERFSEETYWFGTEPNAFLAAQAQRLKPGQKALTIADGEGRNGVWLARQGLAVTSVDFSPKGVAKAKRLAERHGVAIDIICADIATWDWGPPRFDVVVGIFFQFAPPKLRAALFHQMEDALVPGGLLLIEGYRPEQLAYRTGGPPQVDNLYTAEMLRAAFAEMEILELAEYDAVLNEGSRHQGMSALIDLVARKLTTSS
jgi:SAM-dependent methyltransferase